MFAVAVLAGCGGNSGGPKSEAPQVPELRGVIDATYGANGIAAIGLPQGASSAAVESMTELGGALLVGGSGAFVAKLEVGGKLDPDFGNGGLDTSRLSGFPAHIDAIAVLSPSRIAIVESEPHLGPPGIPQPPRLSVRRIDAKSVPDTSYGNPYVEDGGGSIVVSPDGRVTSFIGSNRIVSLDPSGSRDERFESQATAAWKCANQFEPPLFVTSVAVARIDDRLVVATKWSDYDAPQRICVIRLNADGTLDPSFGIDGYQVFTEGIDARLEAFRVLVRSDGGILVVLNPRAYSGVVPPTILALTASGSADTSISPTGIRSGVPFQLDTIVDVAIQPNGKLVAAGFSAGTPRVSRVASAADLPDASFGPLGTGYTELQAQAFSMSPQTLLLASDGSLFIGGEELTSRSPSVMKLR
jgi:hypothetical protein